MAYSLTLRFPPSTRSGWLELAAFCAALGSAIAMCVLYNPHATVRLTETVECADADPRMFCQQPAVTFLGERFAISAISPIFLFLEAAQYLVQYLRPNFYAIARATGFNPLRWANYALSASFMNVQIAFLCRLSDVYVMTGIFVATALTMVLGGIDEYEYRDGPAPEDERAAAYGETLLLLARNDNRSPEAVERATRRAAESRHRRGPHYVFYAGCLPFLWVWGVIYGAFGKAAATTGRAVPGFVYAIVIVLFVLQCSFAVHFYLSNISRRGPWHRADFRADGYTWLSVSKQLLAWITFGGLVGAE